MIKICAILSRLLTAFIQRYHYFKLGNYHIFYILIPGNSNES